MSITEFSIKLVSLCRNLPVTEERSCLSTDYFQTTEYDGEM